MTASNRARPVWWGSRVHVLFTIVVFVVLASLDNAAIGVIPAMVISVAEGLDSSKTAVAVLTGASILVTGLTAAAWGYWGDRSSRKRLLLYGTGVWVAAVALSATADTFGAFAIWQLLTAVGLGSIASVGFSIVSDLVHPARRGLAMSFWGLSQGIGTVLGGLMASQLGAENFRVPLLVIAAAGAVFSVLYLATFDVPRGFREPAVAEHGEPYDYRIEREHLPGLWRVRTNRWLVLQGLTAQFAYGSLIWVPLLYQEKVLAEGYGSVTATQVGGLFAAIIALGGLASILGGHLGDRWQRRDPRGRALISAIGILGAIPFFLAFFFIPLRGLSVTDGASSAVLVGEVLRSIVTNPWVAAAIVTPILAVVFTSADSPNWFALVADVNLPEHRGTVFGAGNMVNSVGRSSGTALAGTVAGAIAFPPPLNWAVGLAMFQVFFLPTGYCYWKAAETSPGDIASIGYTLEERSVPIPGPPAR